MHPLLALLDGFPLYVTSASLWQATRARLRRSESLDAHMGYREMGVLLGLAHEFDMPALTLRLKRMLLPPAGHNEVRQDANPPLFGHPLSAQAPWIQSHLNRS